MYSKKQHRSFLGRREHASFLLCRHSFVSSSLLIVFNPKSKIQNTKYKVHLTVSHIIRRSQLSYFSPTSTCISSFFCRGGVVHRCTCEHAGGRGRGRRRMHAWAMSVRNPCRRSADQEGGRGRIRGAMGCESPRGDNMEGARGADARGSACDVRLIVLRCETDSPVSHARFRAISWGGDADGKGLPTSACTCGVLSCVCRVWVAL